MDMDTILRSQSKEGILRTTAWLEDIGASELKKIYCEYEDEFDKLLAEFCVKLGAPTFTKESNPALADDTYCEAFRLASWTSGGNQLLLACVHHDRETPVFISFSRRDGVV
jgi:hypothetical protein